MREIKHLPRVKIAAEDYAFVEETCRRLLAGARQVTAAGTALYYPDTGGKYAACCTRDLCYLLEYAGGLLPREELLPAVDALLAGQREDGLMPDRVDAQGRVVYFPGPPDAPYGVEPPTDNAQFMVKLLDAYYLLTGDVRGFFSRAPGLYRALERVPRGEDGLVVVDPNRPASAWGFADAVKLTGKVFFPSLLYWETSHRLAVRLQELEDHDEARVWWEITNHIWHNLPEFYDAELGLYWAASEDGRRHDLWGSVYAAVMRLASKKQARIIAEFLVEHREMVFWRGHLRHLPKGEEWDKLLAPLAPQTYQNGGYWAVPVGWAVQTMALVDAEAARRVVGEVLEVWREGEVWEWISPYADPGGPGYVASAANLLGAVAPER